MKVAPVENTPLAFLFNKKLYETEGEGQQTARYVQLHFTF